MNVHRPDSNDRGNRIARRLRLLGICILLGATPAAKLFGSDGEPRDDVLAVVDQLFDGMRRKDETLLRGVFAPDARIGSTDVDGFVGSVLASGSHLDEVTFDETVRVDEDLAMAWTPYNIFVDGTFHHCGVDLFILRRIDGQWKISTLDDTRRTTGCDPQRRH